jgi:predicted DNA-binding protein
MTTKINVTFEEYTIGMLSGLAYKEHKSVASLVRELVLEALEMREDFYLSKDAEKLDKNGAKTYSHDEAWK